MKTQIKSKNEIMSMVKNNLINLPTPSSISYMWNMGSMLGMTLIAQIVTGIMLAMHFSASEETAFSSTILLTRNVNSGTLIRALHSNMASLFFALMYTHVFRGMINSSFKKTDTWMSGISMIMLLMATAFLGYVLPWGQMSFWGATVITNLASTIPVLGGDVVQWLWGGYSVSNPTLNRFFPLHFLIPFVLTAMAMIHLISLHNTGSSNPTGTTNKMDMTSFHPMFSWKDILAPSIIMSIVVMISASNPDMMMDTENFIPANPMSAPVHIQPEWYFLFAYAILRSIPSKLGGVIALLMSIIIIAVPMIKKIKMSASKFNPSIKISSMVTAASFMALTVLGAKPMEEPFMMTSKMMGMIYFASVVYYFFNKSVLKTDKSEI